MNKKGTQNESDFLIIHGKTHDGKEFRPSDWSCRLSGAMSTVGHDNRIIYSPHVKPVLHNGVRSVKVAKDLQSRDAGTFEFLIDFARNHELVVL
jgi:hypothetical protein